MGWVGWHGRGRNCQYIRSGTRACWKLFPLIEETPIGQAIDAADASALSAVLARDAGARTAFVRAPEPQWADVVVAAASGGSQGQVQSGRLWRCAPLACGGRQSAQQSNACAQPICRARYRVASGGTGGAGRASGRGGGALRGQGRIWRRVRRRGRTPLAVAAAFGRQAMCAQLLDAGAELEAQDLQGRSVLHLALCGQAEPDLALMLLQRGANPAVFCIKEPKGFTALHRAVAAGPAFVSVGAGDSGLGNGPGAGREGRSTGCAHATGAGALP